MSEVKNKKHLRFAIMIKDEFIQEHEYACITSLLEEGAELCLVIKESKEVGKKAENLTELKSENWLERYKPSEQFFYKLVFRLERYLKRKNQALETRSIGHLLDETPEMKCEVLQKGKFSQYFKDDDLEKIANYSPDFMLRFAYNIIRGRILELPKYGVWSFHHGDEQEYRGGPPGIWEIIQRNKINGVILQRLTDTLDGGVILEKGFFKTTLESPVKNYENTLLGSSEWPAKISRRISSDVAYKFPKEATQSEAPIYKSPQGYWAYQFFRRYILNNVRKFLKDWLYEDFWKIGVVNKGIESFIKDPSINEVTWLPDISNDFFSADPFGMISASGKRVFFEKCHVESGFGSLVGYKIDENFAFQDKLSEEEILPSEHHQSYPYIFEDNGKFYCIPERHQAKKILLYEWDEEKKEWFNEHVLVDGLSGVDNSVVFFDGYWWLFTCDAENYDQSKILLFRAKDIFSDWEPHIANPVKCDIRSSRPAGTPFVFDGKLYRPTQNCAVRYGQSISLNLVENLSLTEFSEKTQQVIFPPNEFQGIHTLSSFGQDQVLIDACVERLTLRKVRRRFYMKSKALKTRLGLS